MVKISLSSDLDFYKKSFSYLIHHHQTQVFYPVGLYQGVDEAVGFLNSSDVERGFVSALHRRELALTAGVFLHHEVQLQAKACQPTDLQCN